MSIVILIVCGLAASVAVVAAARFGMKLDLATREREERRAYLLKRLDVDQECREPFFPSLPG